MKKLACLLLLVSGCGTTKPVAVPEPPRPIEGRFLAFPHADAESLLGREVTPSKEGGYRIGDERAAGCEVVVRKTRAQYKAVRETKTSELASIGGGYSSLVSLEAKYGRESFARLELENVEVVEADLRGPCGRNVITKVFVGHGRRRVAAATDAESSATIGGPVHATPSLKTSTTGVDELAWDDNQAYAFEVRDMGIMSEAPDVDVRLPSIVTEGEDVVVSFESPRDTWLVVYYVDAEDKAEVLWPSNEEPSPKVGRGNPMTLPSPAERAAGIRITSTLSKPGVRARERLVVYAFSDKRDYDLMKPPSGSSGSGLSFTEELGNRLRSVPANRWSRRIMGYTIEPREKKGNSSPLRQQF